jgi:polyhydroxybutyrate depolymerase
MPTPGCVIVGITVVRPIAAIRCLVASIVMAAFSACTTGPAPLTSLSAAPSGVPAATESQMPSPTPTPKFQVGHVELSTNYDGDKRVVELYVPKLPPGRSAPLVVMLHALNSSPFAAILLTRFDLIAERYGAIVAAPPSAGRGWDAAVCCGRSPEPNADTRYLSALLADLMGAFPVDRKRVFVAGFSMGAVMADRVGCEFADRVAAIAIDAGMSWSDACQPAKPVSVLIVHGTSDDTFRYSLGQSLAKRWRSVETCTEIPMTSRVGSTATAELFNGCKAGSVVEFVTVAGGTHAWFEDPDATELAWQFFSTHPRR